MIHLSEFFMLVMVGSLSLIFGFALFAACAMFWKTIIQDVMLKKATPLKEIEPLQIVTAIVPLQDELTLKKEETEFFNAADITFSHQMFADEVRHAVCEHWPKWKSREELTPEAIEQTRSLILTSLIYRRQLPSRFSINIFICDEGDMHFVRVEYTKGKNNTPHTVTVIIPTLTPWDTGRGKE